MDKLTSTEQEFSERKHRLDRQIENLVKKRKELVKKQRQEDRRHERSAKEVIGEIIVRVIGDGDWRSIDYRKVLDHVVANKAQMSMDFMTPQTQANDAAVANIGLAMAALAGKAADESREEDEQACGLPHSQNSL